MILAGRTRGIGYAIADLVTDQAGVLGFAQSVGSIVSSAGYRVQYRTNISGLVPPSAGLYVYDVAGGLRASYTFSGAGLPRRSAGDIAGEILSDIERGVVTTVPFAMTATEREAIMTAASPLLRTSRAGREFERNRLVNGNTYRRAADVNGGEAGNSDAVDTDAGDAIPGPSIFSTNTLLVAGAVAVGLWFLGRGK